jgi:hypothetical protein
MSKETLYWQQNVAGRVFLSDPAADLHPGYMLMSTTSAREMDRVFKKIHEQERDHNQKVIDGIYIRGRERYDAMRSGLRTRLASSNVSEAEKGIIREAMKLMDEKDARMQQNTVYGISAMQEAPAPLPPRNTRVM